MNDDAFVREFQKSENALRRYALKLTGNREDAEELLQETIVRAFCRKGCFADESNFTAWTSTIMHNIFINTCRRELKHTLLEHDFVEGVSDIVARDGIYSAITVREVIDFLRTLPDTLNRPLILCIQGYDYKEIAERLDITPSVVRNRLHKARVIMKRMFKEERQQGVRV